MTRSPAAPGALRALAAERAASVTRSRTFSSSTKRDVYFLRKTEKAIHVQTDDDATVWIPLSQVRNPSDVLYRGEGEACTIEVSPWIAQKLGWV